jgi:ribonuclease BN (tRNA processing enzyme)
VLTVYGPRQTEGRLQEKLPSAVQPPFFPVELAELRGEVCFRDAWNEDFAIGSAKVLARAVDHPGNTLGFRIEAEGKVVAYLPDHQAPLDRRKVADSVLELCHDADVLIHDAQYTDQEFVEKADWGHSTVPYAVRVAAEAGVSELVLFHHDPSRTDKEIDQMLSSGRRLPDARTLKEISAAREGAVIELRHE